MSRRQFCLCWILFPALFILFLYIVYKHDTTTVYPRVKLHYFRYIPKTHRSMLTSEQEYINSYNEPQPDLSVSNNYTHIKHLEMVQQSIEFHLQCLNNLQMQKTLEELIIKAPEAFNSYGLSCTKDKLENLKNAYAQRMTEHTKFIFTKQ